MISPPHQRRRQFAVPCRRVAGAVLVLLGCAAAPIRAHAEAKTPSAAGMSQAERGKIRTFLRDFPVAFTLAGPSRDAEARLARFGRIATGLAIKLKLFFQEPDALLDALKSMRTDPGLPMLDRARVCFFQSDYAAAIEMSLLAGDAAHRAAPRRPLEVVESLKLAACAALEAGMPADAMRFLSIAEGETSAELDLLVWTGVQVMRGHTLRVTGGLRERADLLRRIYLLQKNALGEKHPDVLKHWNELAGALYDNGNDEASEAELSALLPAMEEVKGADHLDACTVRKNLARLRDALGMHDEAETLRREIVASYTRTLGEEHPETLRARYLLTFTLMHLRKFKECEQEMLLVLDYCHRHLGPEHELTVDCRQSLSLFLYEQGRHPEAASQMQIVARQREKNDGPEHPATLHAKNDLGAMLNTCNRHAEAEQILRHVYEARRRIFPSDDLYILGVRNNLGMAISGQQGRKKEAEAHFRAVYEARVRLLGKDHPKTIAAHNNLLEQLDLKNPTEQRAETAAKITAQLGPRHPDAIKLRMNHYQALVKTGGHEEAAPLLEKLTTDCVEVFGEEHPDTQLCRVNHAEALMRMLRFSEAEAILSQALAHLEQQLDTGHHDLEHVRMKLANCLGFQNKNAEALELCLLIYAGMGEWKNAPPGSAETLTKFMDILEYRIATPHLPHKSMPRPGFTITHPPVTRPPSAFPITAPAGTRPPTINEPLKLKF